MKKLKKEQYLEIAFCAVVFIAIMAWMLPQQLNASADETMRYQVVEYLVKYGKLPHGGDPEIRDWLWGISYGFYPYLSSIFSAFFVKITSIFTSDELILLHAARMVNVFLGTATAWITLRIGKRLFKDGEKWLFATLIIFLPGAIYMFSYINNEGLAIFSTALIILMWVRSIKDDWSLKTCIGLAVGISLCALSYYNAYGVILCSVIFFVVTVLMQQKKCDYKFLLKRGAIIAGIVFVLAGWWFIRSYIIYDGDFLGMKTSSWYGEEYGQEMFKPSNRMTIKKMGMSIIEMLFYIKSPADSMNNWMKAVAYSFIGTFRYMRVFMPEILSKAYVAFFGVGLLGVLLKIKKGFFGLERKVIHRKSKMIGDEKLVVKITKKRKTWHKKIVFRWCMLMAVIIPTVLFISYAYSNDFQEQGRYLMPALVPLMYFVTWGYKNLVNLFAKREVVRKGLYIATAGTLFAGMLYTYFGVFLASFLQ